MKTEKEIILGYLAWLADRSGSTMVTQLNGADVDEYLEQQVKNCDLADVVNSLPSDKEMNTAVRMLKAGDPDGTETFTTVLLPHLEIIFDKVRDAKR